MYLEQRAEEDTLFAKNYRNPAKNIDDCVTFKELFVCKSNNKTGDLEMNLLIFSSHTSFSVKAILSVSTPSPKKILNERVPTAA